MTAIRNQLIFAFILFIFCASFISCGDDDDDDSSGPQPDDDDDTVEDDDDDDNDDATDDDDDDDYPAFFADHPFLTDTSLWFGHVENDNKPRKRTVGEFGVGNGYAFALVGTTLPYHTMRNIIGPDYEREPMFFSDKRFSLWQADKKIGIVEQWDKRVRKSSIVLTRSLWHNGLELYTIDFAPKQTAAKGQWSERSIIRFFILRNLSNSTLTNLQIKMDSPIGKIQSGAHVETIDYKHLAIKPLDEDFDDKGDAMIAFPDLAPGKESVKILIFAFTYDGEDSVDVFDSVTTDTPELLLDETYDWWVEWYDEGAVLSTPDDKFNDLMESLQVTIKVQQAATGASCVMSEYTRTWTRDIMGPAKLYPPMGRAADFKEMLDYYYLAALVGGGISNSFSANIVESNPPAPPDWRNKPTMTGRKSAEGPSYISLQYAQYYDYTGDFDPIDERYEMLYHATAHQNFQNDCLLPFSGDETYRDLMGVGLGYFPGSVVYEDTWFSANSSFLFAAAADKLVQYATEKNLPADVTWFENKAQLVRDCTEEYYWLDAQGYYAAIIDIDTLEPVVFPYEDVNTKPIWSGAQSAEDAHQQENILSVFDQIGHDEGYLQTPLHQNLAWLGLLMTVDEGVFAGMQPGYFLDNLARMDHPMAENAFGLWEVLFNDSGNVSEAMVRNDYGRFMYLIEPFGFVSDLTSRFRPWEGGIVGAAMLQYLTGFKADVPNGTVRFEPHMPGDWDRVTFTDAPFGDDTLDAEITDDGSSRTFRLSNGDGQFDLYLRLSAPGPITGMTIDGTSVDPDDYNREEQWGRGRATVGPVSIEESDTLEVEVTY